MARYHGKKGLLYMAADGAAAAVAVVNAAAWSLDGTSDTADVTCFGDTHKVYVLGLRDCKGAFSGFWDETADVPFDAMESEDAVNMYLYPSSDAITKYWYGSGYVDCSVDVPVDGPAAISGNWVAASTWTRL